MHLTACDTITLQKPCKVLGVWEDEAVYIRGSYRLLSIPLSGALLSGDFSLSMRERGSAGSPLFPPFMLWYAPQFGIPFYISTLIFKGSSLLPSPAHALISIALPLRWGPVRARTALIDFWRRVCTVTFSPVVPGERWAAPKSHSEAWEHNHIRLTRWNYRSRLRILFSAPPHCRRDALFDLHTDNAALASPRTSRKSTSRQRL